MTQQERDKLEACIFTVATQVMEKCPEIFQKQLGVVLKYASAHLSQMDAPKAPEVDWQDISTLPDPMNRPGRYWVEVEGFEEHSNRLWNRVWRTVVVSNPLEPLGISPDDYEIIRKQGCFDVLEKVTRWRRIEPAAPLLEQKAQDDEC